MVTYMYQQGDEPQCLAEADINGSGGDIDISDLVWLVEYMYQGGVLPVPCE